MNTKWHLSLLFLVGIFFLGGCKTHENTTYIVENREALVDTNLAIRDLAKGLPEDSKRLYKEADARAKGLQASVGKIETENQKGWWGKFFTSAITLVKEKGEELVDIGGNILTGNYGKAATVAMGVAGSLFMNRQRKQVLLEKDKKKEARSFINDIAWLKDDNEIKDKLKSFFNKDKNKKKES